MAVLFFDTSALAKAYLPEVGSNWVRTQVAPATANRIVVLRLTEVELTSAVTRRRRSGLLSVDAAEVALAEFRADLAREFFVIPLAASILAEAVLLVERYGLRAYDAVQLAGACETQRQRVIAGLPALTFVSSDNELNAAAIAEGFVIENPLEHI